MGEGEGGGKERGGEGGKRGGEREGGNMVRGGEKVEAERELKRGEGDDIVYLHCYIIVFVTT